MLLALTTTLPSLPTICINRTGRHHATENLSPPTLFPYINSKLGQPAFFLDSCSLKMGPIVYPEMSVGNYYSTLHNNPEQRWMEKQHLGLWRRPSSTQRQDRELISGPDLAIWARLLSFNRTQSRVVIDLLTGHNTLRRHLHNMVQYNDPICRKSGTERKPQSTLCECEALASLTHAYLGSFFLDPEDIRVLGMGASWNFAKGTGLL
jgi:hypothetical protein